jgi:hypothetical protein
MIPTLHVLNGDHLSKQLQGASYFQSQLVVREALLVGPVQGDTLGEFWKTRTDFIKSSYNVAAEEYSQKTIQEIERVQVIPKGTAVCLWFEDDLFCQVNLWFILSLLADIQGIHLFRVFPPTPPVGDRWAGFGQATPAALEKAYLARIPFHPSDVALGKTLWQDFQREDWEAFKKLSLHSSPCFNSLEEVCQAQVDRLPSIHGLGKPERILHGILERGITDFPLLFQEFTSQAGVYGFGDLQVKALVDSLQAGRD